MALTIREAEETYLVQGWADGHVGVNRRGEVEVRANRGAPAVELRAIVEGLAKDGLQTPMVLRFPQLLRYRVARLHDAFETALQEQNCPDVRYRGVYPIKVNQQKGVVADIARAGRKHGYGLEVGSKAELIAALTMDVNRRSLLIVNGFKDRTFLEAACHATAFKDDVIIVLDEPGELQALLPLLHGPSDPPVLGLRLKLRAKAPGKWAQSGGDRSKFGLTIVDVLRAVETLRDAGHLGRLQMLHFHIGSQISNIRRLSEGVREATRIYCELVAEGVPLRLLDVGGGLAVDYDGSGSSASTSCNYTMEEYASTVVATVKQVCDEAGVPMPDLISESGRAVVAHHAVLVVDAVRAIRSLRDPPTGGPAPNDPPPLTGLYALGTDLDAKNAFEFFHDALQMRDDAYALFDLGHLSLEAMGRAERMFTNLLWRIQSLLETQDETDSEEYEQIRESLGQKVFANFSVFQSLPDAWGVKQQFPIMPLHRLRERPTERASIADITCDSDGEIRRFIDVAGTRDHIALHTLRPGEPYLLGAFLVGAYQDSLGDYHNLFGETDEASIIISEDGTWEAERISHGSKVADMLRWVRYDPADLRARLRRRIQRLQTTGRLRAVEADALRSRFMALMDSSTYLERDDD